MPRRLATACAAFLAAYLAPGARPAVASQTLNFDQSADPGAKGVATPGGGDRTSWGEPANPNTADGAGDRGRNETSAPNDMAAIPPAISSGTIAPLSPPNRSLASHLPEPAAWAMMILGAGLVGGTLRRSRAGERLRMPRATPPQSPAGG